MTDETIQEKKCKICEDYRGNPPPHICTTPHQPQEEWKEEFKEWLQPFHPSTLAFEELSEMIEKRISQTITDTLTKIEGEIQTMDVSGDEAFQTVWRHDVLSIITNNKPK